MSKDSFQKHADAGPKPDSAPVSVSDATFEDSSDGFLNQGPSYDFLNQDPISPSFQNAVGSSSFEIGSPFQNLFGAPLADLEAPSAFQGGTERDSQPVFLRFNDDTRQDDSSTYSALANDPDLLNWNYSRGNTNDVFDGPNRFTEASGEPGLHYQFSSKAAISPSSSSEEISRKDLVLKVLKSRFEILHLASLTNGLKLRFDSQVSEKEKEIFYYNLYKQIIIPEAADITKDEVDLTLLKQEFEENKVAIGIYNALIANLRGGLHELGASLPEQKKEHILNPEDDKQNFPAIEKSRELNNNPKFLTEAIEVLLLRISLQKNKFQYLELRQICEELLNFLKFLVNDRLLVKKNHSIELLQKNSVDIKLSRKNLDDIESLQQSLADIEFLKKQLVAINLLLQEEPFNFPDPSRMSFEALKETFTDLQKRVVATENDINNLNKDISRLRKVITDLQNPGNLSEQQSVSLEIVGYLGKRTTADREPSTEDEADLTEAVKRVNGNNNIGSSSPSSSNFNPTFWKNSQSSHPLGDDAGDDASKEVSLSNFPGANN